MIRPMSSIRSILPEYFLHMFSTKTQIYITALWQTIWYTKAKNMVYFNRHDIIKILYYYISDTDVLMNS